MRRRRPSTWVILCVSTLEEEAFSQEITAANRKLISRRWSEFWRVLQIINHVVVLVCKADDPLVVRAVSVLRVRVASDLSAAQKLAMEEAYQAHERTRAELREQRARAYPNQDEEWKYKDHGVVEAGDEHHEVDRVIRHEKRGDKVYLLVRWSDEQKSSSWEPLELMEADVPQLVREYFGEIKKALPKRGVSRSKIQSPAASSSSAPIVNSENRSTRSGRVIKVKTL